MPRGIPDLTGLPSTTAGVLGGQDSRPACHTVMSCGDGRVINIPFSMKYPTMLPQIHTFPS